MESSSRIEKTWTEKYKIHEVRFVPATGGFFSMPDRLVAIARLKDEDESNIFMVPHDKVSVTYENHIEPSFILHMQITRRQNINAFTSSVYVEKELVEGNLKLPTGYRFLGLEEKVASSQK